MYSGEPFVILRCFFLKLMQAGFFHLPFHHIYQNLFQIIEQKLVQLTETLMDADALAHVLKLVSWDIVLETKLSLPGRGRRRTD